MKRNLLLVTLLLISSLPTSAAYEEYFNNLIGSNIQIDKILNVIDGKFQTPLWTTIDKNLSVADLVVFEIDDNSTTPLPNTSFTCKLDLQIVSYKSNGDSVTYLKSLDIAYDPAMGKTYKTKQAFKFTNGHRLKIIIKNISYKENGSALAIKPFFKLTGDIQVSRIYKFDGNFVINPNHGDTAKGYLEI